jgi:phage baseplate assembly protein W
MTTKQVTRIYSDIDLTFDANPITGDISKKYDVNSVKQSLKTLILTQFYERPFQPKLGSPVYKMLFENIDIISANALKLQIELMINKYEPRVRSQSVDVEPLYDQNAFNVSIYLYVVGILDPINFSTILKRSR